MPSIMGTKTKFWTKCVVIKSETEIDWRTLLDNSRVKSSIRSWVSRKVKETRVVQKKNKKDVRKKTPSLAKSLCNFSCFVFWVLLVLAAWWRRSPLNSQNHSVRGLYTWPFCNVEDCSYVGKVNSQFNKTVLPPMKQFHKRNCTKGSPKHTGSDGDKRMNWTSIPFCSQKWS